MLGFNHTHVKAQLTFDGLPVAIVRFTLKVVA